MNCRAGRERSWESLINLPRGSSVSISLGSTGESLSRKDFSELGVEWEGPAEVAEEGTLMPRLEKWTLRTEVIESDVKQILRGSF